MKKNRPSFFNSPNKLEENSDSKEETKIQTNFNIRTSLGLKKNSPADNSMNKKSDDVSENGLEAGEYYGNRLVDIDNSTLDRKETEIMKFLDSEKVDWGDPAEKCYSFYNQKKRLAIQKKNASNGVESDCNSGNELDMESSPLLMRRKQKANTIAGKTTIVLKETFSNSSEELTKSEKKDCKLSPTKFKFLQSQI